MAMLVEIRAGRCTAQTPVVVSMNGYERELLVMCEIFLPSSMALQ